MALRRAFSQLRPQNYLTPLQEFTSCSGLGYNDFITAQCLPRLFAASQPISNVGKIQKHYFQTGSLLMKDIEVEIQAMGESISEGTIAEVLKKEGDSVSEDETIAQIETDKVTIDVKAPSAGTVKEIKVATDDTVKVGQVVAVISEGQQGDSGSSKEPAAEPSEKDTSSKKESSDPPKQKEESESSQASGQKENSQSDHTEGRSHKTSIHFPPRMTPDGRRISELPAAEQKQFSHPEGSSAKQEQETKAPVHTKPDTQPAKPSIPWYVGKEQGTKLSQSKVLSQYEMEQIELGGADP